MNCPKCNSSNVSIGETRTRNDYTYRRRYCEDCGCKYSTTEIYAERYDVLKKEESAVRAMSRLLDFITGVEQ